MRWVLSFLWLLGTASVVHAQDVAPVGVEATADAVEARMRELRQGTWELESRVGDSHRRLAAIEMSMRGDAGGARVAITQHNHAGPLYRLVEATYAIDGVPVFHQRDESGRLGAGDLEVHAGAVAPGAHVLTVVLRYDGDGGAVFRYVDGYHFVVRGTHSFVVPEGQRMRLGVDAWAHPDQGYTERLDTVFVERLEPIR
jgi:hypothetical protein